MTFYIRPQSEDLMHYGIKGQKWGVRRFQNADGSLTEEGKRRYSVIETDMAKREQKAKNRYDERVASYDRAMNINDYRSASKIAKSITRAERYLNKIGQQADKYYTLTDYDRAKVDLGYEWIRNFVGFGYKPYSYLTKNL